MRKKRKQKLKTELVLLPRLKYMGYSLLLFSICFFIYALTSPPKTETPPISSFPEEELSAFVEVGPHDTFNFFAISSLFAAIGMLCLFTSNKKLKSIKKKK